MTKNQKLWCNAIIHSASAAAASVGAGLAQLPCTDSAVITPIQIAMTVSLGKVFGVRLSRASAKSMMGTGMTTLVGRAASQLLVEWISVAGNVINAATAGSITEALGWILAKEFEADGADPACLPADDGCGEEAIMRIPEDLFGGETYDGAAENSRLKALGEIGKQLRILQKNRREGRNENR